MSKWEAGGFHTRQWQINIQFRYDSQRTWTRPHHLACTIWLGESTVWRGTLSRELSRFARLLISTVLVSHCCRRSGPQQLSIGWDDLMTDNIQWIGHCVEKRYSFRKTNLWQLLILSHGCNRLNCISCCVKRYLCVGCLALIAGYVFVMHKCFCIFKPLLFPIMLVEVLQF